MGCNKEESHFRHDAVSWAGAMGLMQIMPATGKDIASRLGMTITDNDLLNPEISIKFGSFYISSMMNMFNADIDRAMAAYNGGPGNVRKWLESSFMTSDEDFPTAVTFLETQGVYHKSEEFVPHLQMVVRLTFSE